MTQKFTKLSKEIMDPRNDALRSEREETSLSAHFVKQWAAVPLPLMHNNEAYSRTAMWEGSMDGWRLHKEDHFHSNEAGMDVLPAIRPKMWGLRLASGHLDNILK